jgi:hypothetical protein
MYLPQLRVNHLEHLDELPHLAGDDEAPFYRIPPTSLNLFLSMLDLSSSRPSVLLLLAISRHSTLSPHTQVAVVVTLPGPLEFTGVLYALNSTRRDPRRRGPRSLSL